MRHERIRPLLDDYLDDELSPAARRRVEDHLAECDVCTGELAALLALTEEARALPREMLPSRELWEGIEARLAERQVVLPLPRRWSSWTRPAMMAAAALFLVALSSAVTATLLWQRSAAPGEGSVAGASRPAPAGSALAAFQPTEAEFVRTAEELRQALAAGSTILEPGTLEVIEASLAVIDQAIAEARAALEADPQNGMLALLLSRIHGQKVEVLQQALHHEARS
jgi:predicted anti-sigma-YlaC factor YlaD